MPPPVLCALPLQSPVILCDPMDGSLPGFSVYGILQERILEWVVMPSSKGYSPQRLNPQRTLLIREVSLMSPALTGRFFTTSSILPLITPLYHYQYSQLYFSVLKKVKPTEMLIEQYKAYKYCILLI